jgi:DNA-binding GntR family transcriptional regulator
MQLTSEQCQPQEVSASDARSGRHLAGRELLAAFAGEDIAEKLSDDQITRLNACISELIDAFRQKDFDDGWRAGIDHAVDYTEAYFAPKTKTH